jgi:phosphatidylserine/phosphatidylglycerophosphate/cardiolipin synthase-like enzyme
LDKGAFNHWLVEQLSGLNVHVRYLHTKYMLIDPLGANPLVVSGSANFSEASTTNNDENMLIIRGNPRVADIYLGEFMRLYRRFAFRDWHFTIRAPTNASQSSGRDRSMVETLLRR